MKYLTFFKPPYSLVNKILNEPNATRSNLGLHCTILRIDMDEEFELDLSTELAEREYCSFNMEITGDSNFDKDSRVLLLSKPEELIKIHKNTIQIARGLSPNSQLEENITRYGLERYNPHITIPGLKPQESLTQNYKGLRFSVDRFYLAKKKDEKWINLKAFNLIP